MTTRRRYRQADPAIGPAFPRIFVASSTFEPYPAGALPPCDSCGEDMAQDKGGFVIVYMESVTMHYCPACLVKVAYEIAQRKET